MGAVEVRHREHGRGGVERRIARAGHAGVLDAVEIVALGELGDDVTEVLPDLGVGAKPDAGGAIERTALTS